MEHWAHLELVLSSSAKQSLKGQTMPLLFKKIESTLKEVFGRQRRLSVVKKKQKKEISDV
jgi:hypothetical protein